MITNLRYNNDKIYITTTTIRMTTLHNNIFQDDEYDEYDEYDDDYESDDDNDNELVIVSEYGYLIINIDDTDNDDEYDESDDDKSDNDENSYKCINIYHPYYNNNNNNNVNMTR